MKYLTRDEVLQKLNELVAREGTQRDAAKVLGVHPGYLSDMLAGNRRPGEKVLEFLGLQEERVYKPK